MRTAGSDSDRESVLEPEEMAAALAAAQQYADDVNEDWMDGEDAADDEDDQLDEGDGHMAGS